MADQAPQALSGASWPSQLARFAVPLVLTYFALQTLSRVLVSPSLGLDEAEQLVMTQELAWGYGAQPPLYTWIQWLFFAVLGKSVLALAVLKYLLLAATVLLTFATALRISGQRELAFVAALALFLLPQFAWESQRALTHSVLVTTVTAGFCWSMLQVLEKRRLVDYALLGLVFALGTLSKFNFPLFAVALTLAALSLARFRGAILCRGFLLCLVLAAVVLFFPLTWILEHQEATLSRAEKLARGDTDLLGTYVTGIVSLIRAVLLFLAPLLVVAGLLLIRSKRQAEPVARVQAFVRLFGCAVLIALCICLLLVFGFDVTSFKDRWMQPILYVCPILLVLWLGPRLSPWRLKIITGIGLFIASAILVALPARTLLGPTLSKPKPLNIPYPRLAGEIQTFGFNGGLILAENNVVGGNLLMSFPHSVALTPDYHDFQAPEGAPVLVVWRSRHGPRPPAPLSTLMKELSVQPSAALTVQTVTAKAYYSSDDELSLAFILWPNPN